MWTRISPFISAAEQFVGAAVPGSSPLCPPAETKDGQRPSCPPLPENHQLVDAGASPADQLLATIPSAKASSIPPSSPSIPPSSPGSGWWSLAKVGAYHEAPIPFGLQNHPLLEPKHSDITRTHLQLLLLGLKTLWRWNPSHPPTLFPEPSFPTWNISSLGLQILVLINYYASRQISIAITKRLIATMRCGTPLLQGNFLLFMLWHNIAEQSGRTAEHKFRCSPSAEEAILITAEGWQLAPNLLGALPSSRDEVPHTSHTTRQTTTLMCFYLLSAPEE